jgi:hypothetical protein
MPLSSNKDSFKEVIGIFKKGYNAPSKTFVWGLCKSSHKAHYAKKLVMRSSASKSFYFLNFIGFYFA